MKATAEQIKAGIDKIDALKAVNEQNGVIIARARARLETGEDVTDKALGLIVEFAHTVAACDFQLNNEHDIAMRNVYAFPKVRDLIAAIKLDRPGIVDQYSRAFVHNANLRKDKILDNEAQNSVSYAIESEKARARDKKLHVATSTIPTQRSSSCYALHAVGVCDYVNPGKKSGYLKLTDHPIIPEIVKSYKVTAA